MCDAFVRILRVVYHRTGTKLYLTGGLKIASVIAATSSVVSEKRGKKLGGVLNSSFTVRVFVSKFMSYSYFFISMSCVVE